MAQIKIAEYTFDNSVGDVTLTLTPNTITMTKEDSVSGTTTRRIVYIDDTTLPSQLSFQNQTALLTVDYLHIGSNITNLASLFSGCTKLKTVNTTNWDLSSCTNISFMFQNCSSLTSLDLSNWNLPKLTTMREMFSGCTALSNLIMPKCEAPLLSNMQHMFASCTSMTELDMSEFVPKKLTSIGYMFSKCSKLEYIDLNGFVIDKVTYIEGLFNECYSLKVADCSNMRWIPSTGLSAFYKADKFNTIALLYIDAEYVNKWVASFRLHQKTKPLTVYYYDADPSQLTPVEGVIFKKYVMPTTIQLPPHIQLHSLPDGTRDEVDIKTGILTRNVGYLVLDNADVFVNSDSTHNDENHYVKRILLNTNGRIDASKPTVVCSKIKSESYSGFANKKYEFIAFGDSGHLNYNGAIYMKLKAKNSEEWNTRFNELSPIPVTFYVTPTTEQLILNYNNSCDYGRILPTGMCDKYDVVNSMYTQTMTSILLDGANTWDAMEEFENTVKFTATGTTVGVEELNMLGAGGLYCDNDLFPNINDDSDVEHCRVDEAGNKFYIYISKNRLMSPDLIGWQIWLQANKFNMIYELAEHLTYVKQYEELDATQARWEGMDCMRDGTIKYHANNEDNLTIYPTLEYITPSINNFEVTMLEPNTDYTIYAEGINKNDTINLGGNDINFNNGTVYTSGDNQWLRIDNNDSFYNMVITKGDTTGEVVPYFEGMKSVEMPVLKTIGKNLFDFNKVETNDRTRGTWDTTINNGVITSIKKSSGDGEFGAYATIKVEPSTTYTLRMEQYKNGKSHGGQIYVYNNSSIWGNGLLMGYGNSDIVISTKADTKYITIGINYDNDIAGTVLTTKNIQLEKSSTSTQYEPYKTNTLTFNEPVKLRSLPNGVKDTINVVTGEYVQRVGEITFDGALNGDYTFATDTSLDIVTIRLPRINDIIDTGANILGLLSDKYISASSKQPNNIICYSRRIMIIKPLSELELYNSAEKIKAFLQQNPMTVQYELAEPITTKLDPQTLLAYTDGTINLSSDTGLLPTTHYSVPSTNTFHLPSMKTGTRYTLKYPSASGSITIGDINYSISSDSMLFTTPLKINGDTSAIIFSDANPENVVLLEGAYNKREVPFFTGVKSVKNPNITITDQLSTESTTYNYETEIELRGLPNGVADKLDIIKGKLTTNVGIRPYQEGDENLLNTWTDGYETVYALNSPIVTNVAIDHPVVTTNSLIELSSDYLIPQLNYRAPSSNNFPLDLLQPNTTYTLYADTLTSGSYTLGGTKTGVYSQPHTITLGDMTDNLLTFNGDLGLSNVMLVKGNSLKTTLPPYFLGIRSVTDGHLLVEGMAGEINEIAFDEGIVLRDCNGVKDTIDLITCTLTKRTGEIKLTGAEGWFAIPNKSVNAPNDYVVFALTLQGVDSSNKHDLICDTITSKYLYNKPHDTESIYGLNNSIRMCVKKSRIGGDTVNALKSWLNQNHTTVVYTLKTPLEVQLENVWTTTPPTSYNNQTEISSTVSTNSLKPMISVTIATTTLEEIVSNLKAQNEELENENVATMLALTNIYETFAMPMTINESSTINLSDGKDGNKVNGMSVSPMGMIYAKLIQKGLKTIEQVPTNLQAEVKYALKGLE